MSVAFGIERRRKGRHVALGLEDEQRPGPLSEVESFEEMRRFIAEVPVSEAGGERIDSRIARIEIVVCGDHGKKVGFRGRCPKCAGYAMTIGEIDAHRRRAHSREGERRGSSES